MYIFNWFGLLRKNKVNNPICTNIGQLKDRLEQVWHHEEDIPVVVARGIDNMPRRMKAVIKEKGGTTKY
ncbi:hypothetical protein C0J52_26634 [Blattella germanica]|nr:hypothetical protein C0J52_26634 [Blattella germanica]